MGDFKKIIKLIHKYNAGILTEPEEKVLNEWLRDNSNQQLFDKLSCNSYSQKILDELQRYDVEQAYTAFVASSKKNKFQLAPLLRVAAILTIPIVLGLVFLIKSSPIPADTVETAVVSETVKPGKGNVILTLAGGEQITLNNHAPAHIIEERGVQIVADTAILSYNQCEATPETDIQFNEIYVPRKGEYSLRLSDGSRIYLNADSRLKYPVVFGKGERRVILEGEAFFEITKDSLSPFTVTTGDVDIRVLGTTFNVKAYKEEQQILTTLVSGKIRLEQGSRNITAYPNEQVSCYKKHPEYMQKKDVNARLYSAWKDGFLKFERERLEDITTILGRWYDVEFHFVNPELKNYLFTGDLKKYENIEQHLKMLELTTDIQFVMTEANIHIRHK